MTRDDIIYMARTAGLQRIYGACANAVGESSYEDWDYEIERFAELVAAAEREACAKVCDELADDAAKQQDFHAIHACESCANEIRSRGGDDNN